MEQVLAYLMLILEGTIFLIGLIVFFVLASTKQYNSILLGCLILSISLTQLFEIFTGYGLWLDPIPYGYFFGLLYGPFAFNYVYSYLEITNRKKKQLPIELSPAIAMLVLLIIAPNVIISNSQLFSGIVSLHIMLYLLRIFLMFLFWKRKKYSKLSSKKRAYFNWTIRELTMFGLICLLIILIASLKQFGFGMDVLNVPIILVYCFIIVLLLMIMLKILSFPKFSTPINNQGSEKLDAIREAIITEELYKDDSIRIQSLANHFDISSAEFSDLINRSHGSSFNHFINEIRIKDALDKLSSSDDPIKQIMYETGFSSRTVFNTAFKRITGITPKNYREKHKDF